MQIPAWSLREFQIVLSIDEEPTIDYILPQRHQKQLNHTHFKITATNNAAISTSNQTNSQHTSSWQ